MVGLSFAFPDGIKKDELKLSSTFQNRIDKIPSIEQIIINLDVLCSSLFSISFMMFMMIIGGYVFISATLIAPSMAYVAYFGFENVGGITEYILPAYFVTILVIALIGLFDFLSLGFLKRFKWLSKIYYPIHRLISFLTLASFYRPIYLTLITNFNKWKIGAVLVLFLLISIFMISNIPVDSSFPGESWSRLSIWSKSRNSASYSGYYDDQNTDMYSVQAHIQSDIISDNTVRLFSVLKVENEDYIKEHCGYDSLIKSDSIDFNINLHCASIFYQVLIDDKVIDSVQWRFYYKQKTNQRGILTYLDISDLPKGMHTIKVKGPDERYSYAFAEIPFYREISPEGYHVVPLLESKEEGSSYLQLKPILPK